MVVKVTSFCLCPPPPKALGWKCLLSHFPEPHLCDLGTRKHWKLLIFTHRTHSIFFVLTLLFPFNYIAFVFPSVLDLNIIWMTMHRQKKRRKKKKMLLEMSCISIILRFTGTEAFKGRYVALLASADSIILEWRKAPFTLKSRFKIFYFLLPSFLSVCQRVWCVDD